MSGGGVSDIRRGLEPRQDIRETMFVRTQKRLVTFRSFTNVYRLQIMVFKSSVGLVGIKGAGLFSKIYK